MHIQSSEWHRDLTPATMVSMVFLAVGSIATFVFMPELRYLVAFAVATWVFVSYVSASAPVIRITETSLQFGSGMVGDHVPRLFLAILKEPCVVRACDVESLEWDGFDNIGIRLKSGEVEYVPFDDVKKADQAGAKAAILEFVERSVHAA